MQEIQYIYMCTHVYICVCMNIHRILTNTMPFFFSTEKSSAAQGQQDCAAIFGGHQPACILRLAPTPLLPLTFL